jgi:MFS family permease
MEIWKRNLTVCWFSMFVSAVGMSQIAPVLPLYIRQLGVLDTAAIERYSGIAFGITFIFSAIFSPIWGAAADRYGRKPMLLRASLGMALIIACTGFARNVTELIALRLLLGVITGYATACTTLIATQTDKARTGWALATLSTSSTSGALLGPIVGGYIAERLGLHYVFFITGGLLLIAFLATQFFVQEHFVRPETRGHSTREIWRQIPDPGLTLTLIVTFFLLPVGLYSIEPIVTVYVRQLAHHTSHLALIAGLAFSAPGVANLCVASRLGKLSDQIGPQRVIFASLIVGALIFLPQAFVRSPRELIALRFCVGLATAGLMPSINTLIKRITPDALVGRVYGLTMSAMYLGVFAGAVLGGQVAACFGIRYVFYFTTVLLLINAAWVYGLVYKKLTPASERTIDSNRDAIVH